MSAIAISADSVGKKYKLGKVINSDLRSVATNLFKRNNSETQDFWAIRDISFDVNSGETVGIIGKNGAGKSTLLKIFSKITAPSLGKIEIYGRLASLLEVGTGFHPELTGKENIFLNGAILGMTRKEIRESFDEIVDFAGVEKFLGTPVKHYSSGMYVRLAFSVAAHLQPEILVVDEVLAVGDYEFQKKCLGKMQDVAGEGRTVLFVSHNMSALKRLCKRGILLEKGQLKFDGLVDEAVDKYLNSDDNNLNVSFQNDGSAIAVTRISISSLGQSSEIFDINDDVELNLDYSVNEVSPNLSIVVVVRCAGFPIFQYFDSEIKYLEKGDFQASIVFPAPFFKEQNYTFSVFVGQLRTKPIQAFEDVVGIQTIMSDIQHSNPFSKERPGVFANHINWNTNKL